VNHLWSIDEVAAFLGIPKSTLYAWSHSGVDGPPVIRVGRRLRYDPADVREWIEDRKQTPRNGSGAIAAKVAPPKRSTTRKRSA
jgi:excisionase family DNA binding protein